MEQKNGSQQSVKALLYFAVMSVFLRASLSGPNIISPQHNIHYETLVGTSESTTNGLLTTKISLKDEETKAICKVALSPTDNDGVFSVVIASAATLLNGLSANIQ
ncbi:hypothetical protein C1645_833343 [Glomus cerebriforme]|uniref:Uncharacterized protein n=1 Tax=Glomus cerebriforme TaxID=658196 RepID=A0A397SFS7_9GLOM|nr:hypothetical protein C1645_833343 [Glomus cerebriforme]